MKMYKAEVLCKYPVMQHSLFGSIFTLEKALHPTPPDGGDAATAAARPHRPSLGADMSFPRAPSHGGPTRFPGPEARFPGPPPGSKFPGPFGEDDRFPGPHGADTKFPGPPGGDTRFPGPAGADARFPRPPTTT